MDIARYTIAKRTSVWVLIALTLIGGYISYLKLGRFEDPEFVIRQAVIITPYAGATAQEVSDEVTDVIEGAVQSLQELKEVKSVSLLGRSEVTVEIKLEFSKTSDELQQVWDKLRRKVADAQRQLPRGAGPSIVNDDFSDVYSLFFAVTGEGFSDKQLQDYVDSLRRELVLVPGVAKAATLAEQQETIFIEIASDRLAEYGLSVNNVIQVLQKQSVVTVAGNLDNGVMNIPVIPRSSLTSFDDLRNLQVAVGQNNVIVTLGDIADITRGYKTPPSMLMRYNGERAVGFGISNITGGNVVDMGDAVKARLAELESQRPLGIELHTISMQSESVRASVANFIDNLIAAVVIVFVVLLLFMGVRSGVIIGFVLLLTVAGTLCVMLIEDIAMQRISLGALIIALGMLVDNAIVVTDGVLVRLRQEPNADKQQIVSEVVNSTKWPLLGGTIVGIFAFSAIGLSPSDMGEYAGSLFWVILYSMLLSWVFAVTVTPLLCYDFLKVKAQQGDVPPSKMVESYRRVLQWVLHHRFLSCGVVVLGLFASLWATQFVPPGFMPESQRPQFVVDVYLPQGSDIRRTENVVSMIESDIKQKPGITNITSFIGGGGLRFMLTYSPEARNVSYGQLLIDIDDYTKIAPLVGELQSELDNKYPDASIKVWKFMLGRGGGKKIEAGFKGPDSKVLRQLAEQAKSIMQNDANLIAVQDDWRQQVPVLSPVYSSQEAQRYGLTTQEINAAIAQTLSGRNVGVFREGNDLIPIVVRAPESERAHERAIENTEVYSAQAGSFIPVSQLVDSVDVVYQDAILRRINRMPTILVQADPAPGVMTSDAFNQVREKIEAIDLPSGYELIWYGEYKASKDANEGLAISAPYGFAAMILAVVFMFNALRQPLVIWMTAPLAIIGVVIGLIAFQTPFEFMAILGFLSLIGMMVKNAIVLVDQADAEIGEGKAPYNAIIEASLSRAKPVLLGALTTILGVAPLLIDPFFKSMAVTIMFGLLFATILTLVVIPLFYAVLFKVKVE
ncbi:efflux RND transporter permease subunit [Vibrio parahaemolyticus]|uniref:efflux RND transporter permease subunit n=1 Tax=Vibrio parahaemolyticus TaxID=670 RepID=UPI0015F3B0F9|nr:efflux RND transporter permease subunit [Vibrio parahaemolyticus]EGR1224502.1 efflux RND transporter permease subunit [Vibrio parahaemolyticus]EHU4841182.1 efflux RND transporter permease subunit [Vibrio parahaemolyticus]EHU5162033.1 efflux RND transporter permease subunit [Vibrio parahaemolyticus]EJG0650133.1 efflux RND transporter permease subunit [Vibrio parahaemolyticus]EJG0659642.1 efflux RND transporter permease subunit [Vibrio parahaemolyticus]